MAKSLKTITKQLASRHKRKNKAESDLKKSRGEFFERATEQCVDETLARKTIRLVADDQAMVEAHIEREYPGWVIIQTRETDPEDGDVSAAWEAIIEEDATLKPYKYVNPELGLVFERQIRQGSVMLDDERLKEEQPELYEKITEETRVVKDFDTLDEDTVAAVQPYVYRGKPTVALPAPRKAKEEELADE